MNTDLQAMYQHEPSPRSKNEPSPRSKIAAATALEKRGYGTSLNKTKPPFTLTKQNLLFAINNSDGSLRFKDSQKKKQKKRSSKSFARVDAPFKKSDHQVVN